MGVFIREAIENELRYREGQKRNGKARGFDCAVGQEGRALEGGHSYAGEPVVFLLEALAPHLAGCSGLALSRILNSEKLPMAGSTIRISLLFINLFIFNS
jgi:hypothetical protein